jgi:hypothetical protein
MTTTIEELDRSDLTELGIKAPRDEFVEAYRRPDGSIAVVIYDPYGAETIDNPSNDNSGDDAWEWIEWDSGRQRNEWIDAQPEGWFRDGLDFWIERYEHGQVRYAPTGEASMVDRQWDVAPGVAILRFRPDHGCGDKSDPDGVLNFVRGVCDEYTMWCNGETYGVVVYERSEQTYLLDDERHQTDACWGYLGHEYAISVAKEGD